MNRKQILDNLNNGMVTAEMLTEWADKRAEHSLDSDSLAKIVQLLLMQGIPLTVITEIASNYEINEIRDKNGKHIRWY